MLPAEWFISDLMKYVEQPFYVGLLSAALDREYEKLGYDIGNDTCCVHYVRQPFHCEPPFTKKFMMPFISVIVQGRQ